MRLSIVIPTLNEEQYLPRLLDSIIHQDFDGYEIIVSDGNSKDMTRAVAERYGCLVVSDDKRSPAHQRNEGAKRASGEVILFLDADNILPEMFLKRSFGEFTRKKLDVAGFYLRFESSKSIYRLFSYAYNAGCFLAQYFFPVSVGVGIMVRQKKHEEAGGFDESIFIGEDYDYTKRISRAGKYRMISSTYLNFSVRRLEKEGVAKVLWKWAKGSLYFLLKGPIRKKIVEYEFGEYDEKKK